ncbi:hypothetical protein ACFFRR_010066 [Megaselia abdita]
MLTATTTATSAAVPQFEKNNNVRYQQLHNYSVPRTTKITTISDYNKDNNYDNKRRKANGSNDNEIDEKGDPSDDKEDVNDDVEEEEYFYDSNCCDEINVKRRSSLIRLSILVLIPASIIAIASVCFGKVA